MTNRWCDEATRVVAIALALAGAMGLTLVGAGSQGHRVPGFRGFRGFRGFARAAGWRRVARR